MSLEFTESFSVFNEPITRKLGYINFGFGLDTQPARSPVLVLFIVNYLVCIRSRVTNMTRSFEHREAGNRAVTSSIGSVTSDLLWGIGMLV